MTEEMQRISASGIKKFRKCPKQYWYKYISDVEPPDEGEIEHFQVGNAVHDSLEEVLQEEGAASLTQQELLSRLRDKEREIGYEYDDSEKVQTCLEFASKYVSKYVTDIVSVEDEYNMNLKGIEYIGYADLVADIDFNGEVLNDVIIDWKSGSVNEEWKEQVQGGMYAKMFREEEGRWPDAIHFVYLNEDTLSVHNRIDDGEIMWNDHQNKYWDDIAGDVSKISNALFNDEWEAKPSGDCYWCDYKHACSDYVGGEECEPHHLDFDGAL